VKYLTLLVLAALAAGTRPAGAQAVFENPKLTPSQVALGRSLYRLRDSLLLVDAAAARIARDLKGASDIALRSRARLLRDRCARAATILPRVRLTVDSIALPAPDTAKTRPAFGRALTAVGAVLDVCRAQFDSLSMPEHHEVLRDYGIGRAARVQEGLRRYDTAVRPYFRGAVGTAYLPNSRGAGQTPGPSPQ
jgi:hypothetical protein